MMGTWGRNGKLCMHAPKKGSPGGRGVSRSAWRVPAFAMALLLAIHAGGPAWGWGALGHRVIAKFGERHLSESARAGIMELLEPGESLADASTWADENRERIPGSGPWHYASIPLDEPGYDARFARPRSREGLIVPKIREFQAVLRDRSLPVEERRRALRFLVHLVEDLHQPLHVGENGDRGGNELQVRFFRRGTSLHHLWDSLLLEHMGRDEGRWVAELLAIDDPVERAVAMEGTIEDWATESLRAARQAYRDPVTGRKIEPGTVLGEAYYEANLPVAKRQLYRAGARLAWVLNDTMRPE